MFDSLSDRFQKIFKHLRGQGKLTEENVRKIKQMLKQGRSQTWIASLFGIHQITVSKISRGISWKHVTI